MYPEQTMLVPDTLIVRKVPADVVPVIKFPVIEVPKNHTSRVKERECKDVNVR